MADVLHRTMEMSLEHWTAVGVAYCDWNRCIGTQTEDSCLVVSHQSGG